MSAKPSNIPIMRFRGFMTMLLLVLGACLNSCKPAPKPATEVSESADPPPREETVELLFTYGSEKEAWIKFATQAFHASKAKTPEGKIIRINAQAKGSGELIDALIAGTDHAHIASPASLAFVKLGNAQWRAKSGKDLIGPTESLLLSPVVIAMWRPMAEAIGWGKKPVGWQEILTLAKDPRGWEAHGYPQWGRFKFGHTHPQYSNSGLISLFAEVYAASGKTTGLTPADVAKPETAKFLSEIERSVVHYGSSTGFFGKKMFANGPSYMSAAVLYENMVIEAANSEKSLPFPIVAVYPREGTFWSDHPAGIVEREWVTPEHRDAAKVYFAFLLALDQQKKAMELGFRPAAAEIALTAPFDAAHGVNPREPQTTLEVPSVETMDAIIRLWKVNKKRSNVTLVMDVSGSMNENRRIENARFGASQLIDLLSDSDSFRLMAFNQNVFPSAPAAQLGKSRSKALRDSASLMADGGTALYDAISKAYQDQLAAAQQHPDEISAIVVLTDGADTNSSLKLEGLLNQIRFDSESHNIRVFTIGYDSGGQKDALQKIADATQARFFDGKPENIRAVFKEISTFF